MYKERIFNTPNFSTIQNICTRAQYGSEMLALIGYPGAGKTTGFKKYMEKNKGVFYIWVRPTMNAKQFYRTLARTIGCEIHFDLSLFELMDLICGKLNSTYEKKLIIIDEGGKFQPKFLEYIHELRDLTQMTTGILLSGPEYFKTNVDEWVIKKTKGIQEFKRRISHWEILDPLSKNEITDFVVAYGINDKKFIKNLRRSCDNYFTLQEEVKFYYEEKVKKTNV